MYNSTTHIQWIIISLVIAFMVFMGIYIFQPKEVTASKNCSIENIEYVQEWNEHTEMPEYITYIDVGVEGMSYSYKIDYRAGLTTDDCVIHELKGKLIKWFTYTFIEQNDKTYTVRRY